MNITMERTDLFGEVKSICGSLGDHVYEAADCHGNHIGFGLPFQGACEREGVTCCAFETKEERAKKIHYRPYKWFDGKLTLVSDFKQCNGTGFPDAAQEHFINVKETVSDHRFGELIQNFA